jgi:hypothetical protein
MAQHDAGQEGPTYFNIPPQVVHGGWTAASEGSTFVVPCTGDGESDTNRSDRWIRSMRRVVVQSGPKAKARSATHELS